MSEPTQGPWTARQQSIRTWEILDPNEIIVARTNAGTWGTPYAKTDTTIAANAALIAAAPETAEQRDELLEACKAALNTANHYANKTTGGKQLTWMQQAKVLQAAIAKAEGREVPSETQEA